MTLSLECWVFGEDVDEIFYVEIAETETVAVLKDLIKEEASVRFRDVAASDLSLYSIPSPGDEELEAVLGSWRPTGAAKLDVQSKLSALSLDSDKFVIVDGPRATSHTIQSPAVVPSVTLGCWVHGQEIHRVFSVKISSEETVYVIKEVIKEKCREFWDIDADALALYKVWAPDDDCLESTLAQWNPDGNPKLNARTRLSTLFPGADALGWLVIVVAPPLVPDLTLNCWVHGEEISRVFTVKISSKETISVLREVIKEKKPVDFRDIYANTLDLYKVSVPCDKKTLGDLIFGRETSLFPLDLLSEVFPEPPIRMHVHIVVKIPLSVHVPAALPSIVHQRMEYIKAWATSRQSPSQQGEPSNFEILQSTERRIEWTRSPHDPSVIPVTLLHPVFGQFVDDCYDHKPTSEDNSFALYLYSGMSGFFGNERRRREEFACILRYHDIEVVPSSCSGWTTDGDLHVNGRRYAILEVKNEIGSKAAEPYCEAILNYMHATKDEVEKALEDNVAFNFPCLIVTLFGPHISFSGAVWVDRPHYQVLSTALTLFSHPTDTRMRQSIARHVGAFRNACGALKELYEKFDRAPIDFRDLQPEFPHPRFYTTLDDKDRVHFRYVVPCGGLVFAVQTDAKALLCVKFAQAYSMEAHLQCARMGIAPSLRGHDDVPGGWQMIVMDLLHGYDCLHDVKHRLSREERERLREELGARLTALHRLNLVHGDVRDANVMVEKGGSGWKLIDFEWSGELGQVRYPTNVNRARDLRRPAGAIDGELILADHDMEMLQYLF